jgi:hypothetical protein
MHRDTHSLSAIDGCEGSASRPGRFIPGVKSSSTHWVGGEVDRTTCLDAVAYVGKQIPVLLFTIVTELTAIRRPIVLAYVASFWGQEMKQSSLVSKCNI